MEQHLHIYLITCQDITRQVLQHRSPAYLSDSPGLRLTTLATIVTFPLI